MINMEFEGDQLDDQASDNNITAKTHKGPCPLEQENKKIFKLFKILGVILIRWDKHKKEYVLLKVRFFISYTFWFFWPLLGLCVALVMKRIFKTSGGADHINDAIESSLFVLGFAVVPAIKTYSLSLINTCLLGIMKKTVSLKEIKDKFEKRNDDEYLPSDTDKEAFQDNSKLRRALPIMSVILSTISFLGVWIYDMIQVVEWDELKREWPFFFMQFNYLTLPCITTLFSVIFIDWLRKLYKIMREKLEELVRGQKTTVDVQVIQDIGDYVKKLQDIFSRLSSGFLTYVLGFNFLVSVVGGIFCTAKVLQGFPNIIYLVPLTIAVFHIGLICHKSQELMDEHERIILLLKQLFRKSRKNPKPLPYDELHILLENLLEKMLESPPQVATFGNYKVGNGLLLATLGFIISYAMLANDVLQLQDQVSSLHCNFTLTE
ncbi:uncharacterized protein LOC121877553 [Homarus americanus]|uniref:Uncharacterized protein n=1 Tax=Homarus americanus TaxID=6706 RepID=A0A8J5JKL5_HOMAM|nr:uncharacterized protein LOC121877553 [Homarus americanus]KAG7159375.1 hypothetical protein Hamer_G022810 [Homarus americanus]